MAFPAGLRVVEWSEAVTKLLDLVKFRLVGLMRRIIDHAVGFVVKARGCVGRLRGDSNESKSYNSRCTEEPHGVLPPRTDWEPGLVVNITLHALPQEGGCANANSLEISNRTPSSRAI